MKKIRIFTQRNGRVELVFSLKVQMIKTNLKEQSLAAHKIVYEGVSKERRFMKVEIKKKSSLIWNNPGDFLKQVKQKISRVKLLEKYIGKKERNLKKFSAENKVVLEFESKVADGYNSGLCKLKDKLCK